MMVSRSSEPESSRSGILTSYPAWNFMSKPSCGLIWFTLQGRSLRGSWASRMALSVLKVRTSPPGPEPVMRLCAGKVGLNVRETMGTQKRYQNGIRGQLDEVIVDRQCTQ